MDRVDTQSVGMAMAADPGTGAGIDLLKRADTQASIAFSDISPEDIPPGIWETKLHGTCPRCHHFHISVPLTISRLPGVYNGVRCQNCGHKWFGIGGNSTHSSLVSQETLPRSYTIHSLASSEVGHGPSPSSSRQLPSVGVIATSMRFMAAVGSPPLSAVSPSGTTSPVTTRQRSVSQATQTATLYRPDTAVPSFPNAPARKATQLLSPIDCALRGSGAVSAPVSPIDSQPPDSTLPVLGRSKSLKDRVKGGINKVACKFGYEIRRVPRSVSASEIEHGSKEAQSQPGQEGSESEAHAFSPPGLFLESPIELRSTAQVEYRPTPSGRAHSSPLELRQKRRELSEQARRPCGCNDACNCNRPSSSTISQYGSDSSSNESTESPEPTTPSMQPEPHRQSLDLCHVGGAHEEPLQGFGYSKTVHEDDDMDDRRWSTSDTISLSSGVVNPDDPNLLQLASDISRLMPSLNARSTQQPPSIPSLRVDTTGTGGVNYTYPYSSNATWENNNELLDGDQTPTNRNREV